jgi:hypothetical protein
MAKSMSATRTTAHEREGAQQPQPPQPALRLG